ncbi:MAG: metallophosphoesterase, partial [Thermoanaerobaculia bacterium]
MVGEARVRALVVSDLHANAEALRAVMKRVHRKKYELVVCLGDFVGYGA